MIQQYNAPLLLISLAVYVRVCTYSDFLFNRCLLLKCFKSQNFSVKQSLQVPPLGVPRMIDIIFHFMLGIFFHLSISTCI